MTTVPEGVCKSGVPFQQGQSPGKVEFFHLHHNLSVQYGGVS